MAKRLCLVDDLKLLKITISNTSSRNKLNLEVKDHYNMLTRENQEYELKTMEEAYGGVLFIDFQRRFLGARYEVTPSEGWLTRSESYWAKGLKRPFRSKNSELKTLIATYDIPLDLRPRLPDSNFSQRYRNWHPNSCVTDEVPTDFNQDHVDRIKAHIVRLCDISEGVLVWSEVIMSIYDFLCMLSLDGVAIREEPHGLDTSLLDRVADHTTAPTPAGAAIPRATLEETAVTQTNRKTKVGKKGSEAGSSRHAAGCGVEQVDDGTLNNGDQGDDTDFSAKDIESFNDVSQDKEVTTHVESSGGMRRTTRASSHVSHDKLDADDNSDDNVTHHYEARVANTVGDVIGRDLLPPGPGPYYMPYPYDEELYKDPKVCRTALDQFPTPAESHRLEELSPVELFDRMSVLQCQLISHGSILNARYDHSLRDVDRLSKWYAQQTLAIKQQNDDFRQQSKFIVRANEEVARLTTQLIVLESKCQAADKRLSSWDKKHRKYKAERDAIASGEFNQAFSCVLSLEISVGVEHGLRMACTDTQFQELSQRVDGFIPGVQEKFNDVVAAFFASTFPFLDKVVPPHKTSATTSLRANTHGRHSIPSSGTFGHTSTPEHLKKKKYVGTGAPPAV
ncbi:hypothetical protein Tco_1477196 [Tanacetum coccineum]